MTYKIDAQKQRMDARINKTDALNLARCEDTRNRCSKVVNGCANPTHRCAIFK